MADFTNVGPAPTKRFYDEMVYEELEFRKQKGADHSVGQVVEAITPTAEEIRLLGNRHKQCEYYRIGVDVCHTAMLQQGSTNFLACKEPIDGMWRCYTEEKYGQSIRDAPAYTKQYERKFYDCLFRQASGMDLCMAPFANMIRSIHRSGESTLNTQF